MTDVYRGVILVKRRIGARNSRMFTYEKRFGKVYNKPGPAKAWVTIHSKEYKPEDIEDVWIERPKKWKRVD